MTEIRELPPSKATLLFLDSHFEETTILRSSDSRQAAALSAWLLTTIAQILSVSHLLTFYTSTTSCRSRTSISTETVVEDLAAACVTVRTNAIEQRGTIKTRLQNQRTMTMRKQRCVASGLCFALLGFCIDAFALLPQYNVVSAPAAMSSPRDTFFRLFALPAIKDMRIKEMRSELESYGISTRTFLEKTEFVDALKKARDEGMTPKNGKTAEDAKSTNSASESATKKESTNSNDNQASTKKESKTRAQKNGSQQQPSKNNNSAKPSGASRAERLKAETDKAKSMRVSELKQKLKDMGVNTKSFFEKTEFCRAYAEAVVDGVSGSQTKTNFQDEDYDPEYRDVVIQKFDPNTQKNYLLGGTIIDIKL